MHFTIWIALGLLAIHVIALIIFFASPETAFTFTIEYPLLSILFSWITGRLPILYIICFAAIHFIIKYW